ncbi:MAG: ammonium transporter, Amt family [Thermodesulfobacteriota bacterium]|nr:ammonium transporter, Amt family [Thermodesulfobacteriota bacterium]
MNAADNAWVLVSSALVLLMTPGLAMFYGGLTRSKNVLSTMMHSFFIMGLASIIWLFYGFSLAFAPDSLGGLLGGLDYLGLRGIGSELFPDLVDSSKTMTIPGSTFMIFQCMFAIITPALITGAFAERMKFSSFMLFILLWITLVYCPVAHWVWGPGGWLSGIGAMDFAGGTVVHVNAGAAALACCLMIGKRKGYGTTHMIPHNLTLTLLGAGLLWFGWFGFNAGSALAASEGAAMAFVVTHMATAAAALAWVFTEWMVSGKPTTLGVASGAVAGLVAITPASGFVGPISAVCIGIGAGVVCYLAVLAKGPLGYDDSFDVVGVHGVGGAWGAIATGLFASKAVNAAGSDGLFFGNAGQLWPQIVAIVVTMIFSFVMSLIILAIIKAIVGLRVTEEEEMAGVDTACHGETGYNL